MGGGGELAERSKMGGEERKGLLQRKPKRSEVEGTRRRRSDFFALLFFLSLQPRFILPHLLLSLSVREFRRWMDGSRHHGFPSFGSNELRQEERQQQKHLSRHMIESCSMKRESFNCCCFFFIFFLPPVGGARRLYSRTKRPP